MEKSLRNSVFRLLVIFFGILTNGSSLTITPQPPTTVSSTNSSTEYSDIVTATEGATAVTPTSNATVSTTEPQQKDIVFPGITASNLTLLNTSDSIWRQALDNRPSPWKGFVVLDNSDFPNTQGKNSMQTSTSSFPTSLLTSSWSTTPRTVIFLPNPTQSMPNLPPIYLSPSTPAPTTSGYPRPTIIPVPHGDGPHRGTNQRNRDNQNHDDNKSHGESMQSNRYNPHPNRDNMQPDSMHPIQYNTFGDRYNTHANQQIMHSNRDYAHPNRDYAHPNRDNKPYSNGQRSREHPMAMKYPVHGRNMAVGKSYSGMPPATFSISSASLGPSMPMAPSYGSSMSSSGPSYSATRVPYPPMTPMNPMSPMNGATYGSQGAATNTGYEASYSHDYGSTLGGGYGHMMGYGPEAHGYGGYVAPKEDFGLKGLLGKLLTLIPIGLLLAVALPSLIVIPNRRSVSDGSSGRGELESYPILDMISYYGVDSLQDDKCLRHVLCKTVRMGSHREANVFQKHLWSVVRWMDEGLAQKMGMKNLWADIVKNECSKYKCRKTKKDKD